MLKRLRVPRILITTFATCYIVVALLGATWSWFVGSDKVVNYFRTPELEFGAKVVDVFTPPGGISQGDSTDKIVAAENTKSIPAFVRLMVMPTIVTAEGQPLEAQIGTEVILLGENRTDWIYGNDGYYYYKDVLGPAGSGTETSEALFTGVKLADSLGWEYSNAKMNIVVKIEAIDTKKWNYRSAWWNVSTQPSDSKLREIDAVLAPKAR